MLILNSVLNRHLFHNGPTLRGNKGLVPYMQYNGINNYSYCRAGDYAGVNGFTLGFWCYSNFFSGQLASVYKTGGNAVWRIDGNSGSPYLAVSEDGLHETTVTTTVTVANNTWFFLGARYNPSQELAIWINDVKTVETVSIPASLFVTSVPYFVLGSDSDFSVFVEMRLSSFFFTWGILADVYLNSAYALGRNLFNV